MVLPRLIHPCDIKIERIDRDVTFYDEDAREPLQQAERLTEIVLPGQPKWESTVGTSPAKGGVEVSSVGYVLFRKVDLDAANVEIQDGDRIVAMGHLVTDVFVIRTEWLGHYPDQVGPSLVKAFFQDRSPSTGGAEG